MMRHLRLPLDPDHFERRLTLFAEAATEVLAPAIAANVIDKSQRIATNDGNCAPAIENRRRKEL